MLACQHFPRLIGTSLVLQFLQRRSETGTSGFSELRKTFKMPLAFVIILIIQTCDMSLSQVCRVLHSICLHKGHLLQMWLIQANMLLSGQNIILFIPSQLNHFFENRIHRSILKLNTFIKLALKAFYR